MQTAQTCAADQRSGARDRASHDEQGTGLPKAGQNTCRFVLKRRVTRPQSVSQCRGESNTAAGGPNSGQPPPPPGLFYGPSNPLPAPGAPPGAPGSTPLSGLTASGTPGTRGRACYSTRLAVPLAASAALQAACGGRQRPGASLLAPSTGGPSRLCARAAHAGLHGSWHVPAGCSSQASVSGLRFTAGGALPRRAWRSVAAPRFSRRFSVLVEPLGHPSHPRQPHTQLALPSPVPFCVTALVCCRVSLPSIAFGLASSSPSPHPPTQSSRGPGGSWLWLGAGRRACGLEGACRRCHLA